MTQRKWSLRIPAGLYKELHDHLFPGDNDEHGAIIEAGLAQTKAGTVLLARRLVKAREGIDWVPGNRGYRMLKARFVTERIRASRDEKLVYLAVHNHGGRGQVAFSGIDLQTHERGFPALLDIAQDKPVGGLVFADDCVAGDIWDQTRNRFSLDEAYVIGPGRINLMPKTDGRIPTSSSRYDRQVRLFGDRGQQIFRKARVAIIGLGGVGILLAELLGRLGVGNFVLIDPDQIRTTNLSRMVHATDRDAMAWLTQENRPAWLRRLGYRLAKSKIRLAEQIIKRANRHAEVASFRSTIEDPGAIQEILTCDYIFLAADSHRARLLVNAIAHQYLIPMSQLGSRIRTTPETGAIEHVHTVVRWVLPDLGCLACNGAINPARLQEESISPLMLQRQKYTDDPEVIAPSVITLNAETASQAVNDFLFYMTGLASVDAFTGYVRTHPMKRIIETPRPRKDPFCGECGRQNYSRFAMGDAFSLPLL